MPPKKPYVRPAASAIGLISESPMALSFSVNTDKTVDQDEAWTEKQHWTDSSNWN